MNFSYTIDRNNMRGELRAETVEGLTVPGRTFALTLTTSKSSRGGISAIASVAEHKDGYITMDLFGDWRATLATSPARATEKAIRALHEKALEGFADALVRATAHTILKVAKTDAEEARAKSYTKDAADAVIGNINYTGHPSHY